MPMLVVETYVDVKNPAKVEAVVVYRSYDEANEDWGTLWKSHLSHFGPVNDVNIEFARGYVNSFRIGERE